LKDYSMTSDTLGARLETFKQRVDSAITSASTLADTIEYKRVGGLNFLSVGALRLQWSIKGQRKQRATKPVAYKPEPVTSNPIASETTVPNWQERMRIGTNMSR